MDVLKNKISIFTSKFLYHKMKEKKTNYLLKSRMRKKRLNTE